MARKTSGFTACYNRGFHLTFENGYTLSVQFGPMNYCEHHHNPDYHAPNYSGGIWESENAEIAIIQPDGDFKRLPNDDTVDGYQSVDDVARLIAEIRNYPKEG